MNRRIITIRDKIEAEYSDGEGLPDIKDLEGENDE